MTHIPYQRMTKEREAEILATCTPEELRKREQFLAAFKQLNETQQRQVLRNAVTALEKSGASVPPELKAYAAPPAIVPIMKAWIIWAAVVTVFSGVLIVLAR